MQHRRWFIPFDIQQEWHRDLIGFMIDFVDVLREGYWVCYFICNVKLPLKCITKCCSCNYKQGLLVYLTSVKCCSFVAVCCWSYSSLPKQSDSSHLWIGFSIHIFLFHHNVIHDIALVCLFSNVWKESYVTCTVHILDIWVMMFCDQLLCILRCFVM